MRIKNSNKEQRAPSIPAAYQRLFEKLKEQDILWCSWKSNEHLAEGLSGGTDIDVLFEEKDRQRVIDVMRSCGFVIFESPVHRKYPGVIDALAIDHSSGHILHAHSHFLLVSGEKNLKSFILPWNDFILKNTVPSEILSLVPTSHPSVETVLLLTRESLKVRWRDQFRTNSGDPWGGKGFKAELDWLKERVSVEHIAQCAKGLLGDEASKIISDMVANDASFGRFVELRDVVKGRSQEKSYRRMGGLSALFSVWLREGLYILTRIAEKLGLQQQVIVRRRTLPGQGVIVAFLGPDGSGKSTVTRTIAKEWSKKLDVACVYFGTGDGDNTLLQYLVKVFVAGALKLKRVFKQASSEDAAKTERPSVSAPPSFSTVLYAVSGALSKKQKMRRITKLRDRGFVVICDRWPQNQVLSINDGPLLSSLNDHPLFLYRFLARWEATIFREVCSAQAPDVVIRLIPSLDVAVARKVENKNLKNVIAEKIKSLETIQFPDAAADHLLDADRPLQGVLEDVREVMWAKLQSQPVLKPRVYECLGLSGAGKTTACERIYNLCGVLSVGDIFPSENPISTANKLALTIYSLLSDPLLYGLILKLTFELGLFKNRKSLSYLFKLPVQKTRLINGVKESPALLEQLLLQNIWSALVCANVKSIKPHVLSPFLLRLYRGLDPVVLYFTIAPEDAAKRVYRRKNGSSRFDGLPQEETLKQLTLSTGLMNDLMVAASYAGLDIRHIDGGAPVDQVSADLKGIIEC